MLVKVLIAGALICLRADLGGRMHRASACSMFSEIMHHICDSQ